MDARSGSVTLEDLLAHGDWVRALARHLVADSHAADDAAQDTWVAAIRRPPVQRGNLRAWLARVLRRQTSDRRRAAARRARHEALAPPRQPAPAADELVARAETATQIGRAVLSLSEPYRSTLLLRHFEGREVAEIAALHATPEATVRTRLQRGVALVRERLGASWGVEDPEVRRRVQGLAGLGAASAGALAMGTTKSAIAVGAVVLLLVGGVAWWTLGPFSRPSRPATDEAAARAGDEALSDAPRLAGRADDASGGAAASDASAPEDGRLAYPALTRAPVRIEGMVRDAEGRPAVGAVVEARSSAGAEFPLLRIRDDRQLRRTVAADAEGRFVLEGLPDGPYVIQASRGAERAPWRLVVARPDAAPWAIALAVPDPKKVLAVRVVDASGRPVAGATVDVRVTGDGRAPVEADDVQTARSATTDADGRAAWPELVSVVGYFVARTADGRVGTGTIGVSRSWIEDDDGHDVVVAEPGSVSGRVTVPGGGPAEGVFVEARLDSLGRAYWSMLSSPLRVPVVDGRYAFEGLPAGTYEMTVVGGGWTNDVEWRQDDRYPVPTTVEVPAGGRAVLDLSATRGGVIEGTVVGPSGPLPGAWVRVVRDPRTVNEPDGVNLAGTTVWRLDYSFVGLPDHPLTHHRAAVGADGRYRVDGLRPGVYRVEASAPGATFVQRIGQKVALDAPLVVDATLEPAGVLQGSAPGVSYLGVRRPGSETCEEVAILPSSGLFTFAGLPAGEHELAIVYWGWETTVVGRARVEVGRTTWVDLRNSGPHGVTGRLLVDGEPLGGAPVGRGWGEDSVRADASGRFELRWPRPGGTSKLAVSRVLPTGGSQTWDVRGLPVVGSGRTDLGDVELGGERLAIEVVGADGRGQEARIDLRPDPELGPPEPTPGVEIFSVVRSRTGDDGRLEVTGLQAGLRYVVETPLAPHLVLRGWVTPPSREPLRLVAPRTAPVVVRVRTAAGDAAADATLWIGAWTDRTEVPSEPAPEGERNPAVFSFSARTDAQGRAELPAVPAGAVRIVASGQADSVLATPPSARLDTLVEAGAPREIELTLP